MLDKTRKATTSALTPWNIEKRKNGWFIYKAPFFSDPKASEKGPYRNIGSATLMIAREPHARPSRGTRKQRPVASHHDTRRITPQQSGAAAGSEGNLLVVRIVEGVPRRPKPRANAGLICWRLTAPYGRRSEPFGHFRSTNWG
jgi:hypothetical protein